nr:defensin-like protein [Phaseolus vulgaris]
MGPRMVAEARTCESQSHRFKGPCVSDTNCASVCRTN